MMGIVNASTSRQDRPTAQNGRRQRAYYLRLADAESIETESETTYRNAPSAILHRSRYQTCT